MTRAADILANSSKETLDELYHRLNQRAELKTVIAELSSRLSEEPWPGQDRHETNERRKPLRIRDPHLFALGVISAQISVLTLVVALWLILH